jgi:hypothetical protein
LLAHYYHRRIRPRQAYALGLIPVWAKLASHRPGLANALLRAPLAGRAGKWAAGVAQGRSVPEFAATTFRERFGGHRQPEYGGPEVMLWPDTFTDHFTPEISIAAVGVLEDAGYTRAAAATAAVLRPPVYDYGCCRRPNGGCVRSSMSCLAVFRDELVNLFPDDLDARRLSRNSFTLGEFLAGRGYQPPALSGRALVQVHCHHGAVLTYPGRHGRLTASLESWHRRAFFRVWDLD